MLRSPLGPLRGVLLSGVLNPCSADQVPISPGGGSDSYYYYFEYLLKYAHLTNTDDPIYMDTWKTGVDSSINKLLKVKIYSRESFVISYLADFDGWNIRHVGSHLAYFHAGNWLPGGKLLLNQTIIDIALSQRGLLGSSPCSRFLLLRLAICQNTYAGTATGIGPEAFAFISSDGNFAGGSTISSSQLAFYNLHRYYITSAAYIMRPEGTHGGTKKAESHFVYSLSCSVAGDTKYLDRAVSAIDTFNKFMPATVAFAGLINVNSVNGGLIDDMESFWFAEMLKYLYFTFDDPTHISLDDFVFNTECQPFKAPSALDSYAGSGSLVKAKPFTVQSGELPQFSPSAFLSAQKRQ
ncbi:glycoside hydrolase [Mycena leptocephala]|nr:glycoside hydrolase [Mycena leptocephala]